MVLLRVLHALSRESGWKLTVAHLNHQLRGVSSLADERLVRWTAQDLKLPIAVERANVRGFANERRLSIEMAARRLRHEFLARTAVDRQIPTVALAHHLDDQLELFFLRLLRGSGSQGLSGMKWKSPSPANFRVTLARPLLECSKKSLKEFASEQNIGFREDASNACLDFQRNRIRHELLPLLVGEYQPALKECLSRAMDILSAESDFISAIAESWLRTNCGTTALLGNRGPGINLGQFDTLPVAIQRRCIQLQLIHLGITGEYNLVEHLRKNPEKPIEVSGQREGTCTGSDNAEASSPDPAIRSLRLLRKNGKIVLLDKAEISFRTGVEKLDLRKPGRRDWHDIRFSWTIGNLRGSNLAAKPAGTENFDADKVGSKAIIRHWRPGDRFQPIGLEKPAKLQDLFINQKVPRTERRHLLVATTTNGDIFWVEGLRISERFKLTNNTNRRLQWRWQRL